MVLQLIEREFLITKKMKSLVSKESSQLPIKVFMLSNAQNMFVVAFENATNTLKQQKNNIKFTIFGNANAYRLLCFSLHTFELY